MNVAVPREKHSLRFGHASDSHTECSDFSRSSDLISCRSRRLTFFSRIQSGRRPDIEDMLTKQNRRPETGGGELRAVQMARSRQWPPKDFSSDRAINFSASASGMFFTMATSETSRYLARSYIFFSRNERLFFFCTSLRFLRTSATSSRRPVFIFSRFSR